MKLNQIVLKKALDWAYAKALSGTGGFESAYKVADDYLNKTGSREAAVEKLTTWQVAKCATSGFVTGLGGLITLPVAIPANISSVLLLQLRMILSIAILGGFDPKSEQVKSLAFICLTGSASSSILNEISMHTGRKTTARAMQNISESVVKRINYLVKIRLLTKTGRLGILNLGKTLPLIGGVIGGTIDAAATQQIGRAAKRVFISDATF